MASKKFKPPLKENKSTTLKASVSLTNLEYENIFEAVINPEESSQKFADFKSPPVGTSPQSGAVTPKECASLENSQNTNNQSQNVPPPNEQQGAIKKGSKKKEIVISSNQTKQIDVETSNQSESVSTIHSEDFKKNAAFSTPKLKGQINKKPKSFREAVKNLKDSDSQANESLLISLSQAAASLNNSLMADVPYSQPPAHLNQLERLLWLQERRGENVFVQCDDCDKWRLSDVQDPVDLPDNWYCHMNKDKYYSNCSVPEQKLSIYVEADLILNKFTAGTVVWAKIYSYPWWPSMVDDDPDTEQFYWIDDYDLNVPTSYNVTFFDGPKDRPTRAWIPSCNLKVFKSNINLDNENYSGKYKSRIKYAKEQALDAMNLPIKERLKKYSFISKYRQKIQTPLPTPINSASEDEIDESRSKPTKKITKNRRNTVGNTTAELQDTKKKSTIRKRRNTLGEKESKQTSDKKSEGSDLLLQNADKTNKITKRRNTTNSAAKLEKHYAKEYKTRKRRNTIVEEESDKKSKSEDSNVLLQKPQTVKQITKRRNTQIPNISSQDAKNEEKLPKRRATIVESNSSQMSGESQDSFKEPNSQLLKINKPRKIVTRRSTRADTSSEIQSFSSQDSSEGKRITKRRSTTVETSNSSQNSIESQASSKDSNLAEPKKIAARRSARLNTSSESQNLSSQGSEREKRITKRRATIIGNDSQNSNKSVKDRISPSIDEGNKIKRRRNTISEKDSSDSLTKYKRTSIIGVSQNVKETPTKLDNSNNAERSFAAENTSSSEINQTQQSDKPKALTKQRKTLGTRKIVNISSDHVDKKSTQHKSMNGNERGNESTSSHSLKINKRRNTFDHPKKPSGKIQNLITMFDKTYPISDKSDASDNSEKDKETSTSNVSTILEESYSKLNVDQKNTKPKSKNDKESGSESTRSSTRSLKVTKRRNTLGDCDYPTKRSAKIQNLITTFKENSPKFDESDTKDSVDYNDNSLEDIEIKHTDQIVSKQNLSTIFEESHSKFDNSDLKKEATKSKSIKVRRNANRFDDNGSPATNDKNIAKKRTHTTTDVDQETKKIKPKRRTSILPLDNDDDIDIDTLSSLSQESLNQLDEVKKKKKFLAICQEIVTIDTTTDTNVTEKEKLFYDKLKSSLNQLTDVKYQKTTYNDGEIKNKNEIESQEIEAIPKKNGIETGFKSPTIKGANSSVLSDISDASETKIVKSRRFSIDENKEILKKNALNKESKQRNLAPAETTSQKRKQALVSKRRETVDGPQDSENSLHFEN